MPLATKNNAIIVKDGKVADNCNCCDGQCPYLSSHFGQIRYGFSWGNHQRPVNLLAVPSRQFIMKLEWWNGYGFFDITVRGGGQVLAQTPFLQFAGELFFSKPQGVTQITLEGAENYFGSDVFWYLVCCDDPGACCESNGACSVKPQCQCQGTGQTFKGVGTTCTPNPCNPLP